MAVRIVLGAITTSALAMMATISSAAGAQTARGSIAASPSEAAQAGPAGTWLVVPRRTPESVANGGIPRSFRLSADRGIVRGVFRLLRAS